MTIETCLASVYHTYVPRRNTVDRSHEMSTLFRHGLCYVLCVTITTVCCGTEAGMLLSAQREVERVEDVVSWETVVERYIEQQGGQPDNGDYSK